MSAYSRMGRKELIQEIEDLKSWIGHMDSAIETLKMQREQCFSLLNSEEKKYERELNKVRLEWMERCNKLYDELFALRKEKGNRVH